MPKRLPRPAAAADVQKVFAVICTRRPRKDLPLARLRDRVLLETAYVCGARAGEVCGLYVEDLDLRPDDEHVRIHGKGGTVRAVLLDDRGYVILLKLYLARRLHRRAAVPGQRQRGRRAAVLRRRPPPLDRLLRRGRARYRYPSAPPLPRHRISTQGCPSKRFAAVSGTRAPTPRSCTPCSTTRSPTPRSAPPAGAGTERVADLSLGSVDKEVGTVAFVSHRKEPFGDAGGDQALAFPGEASRCHTVAGEQGQQMPRRARVDAGQVDRGVECLSRASPVVVPALACGLIAVVDGLVGFDRQSRAECAPRGDHTGLDQVTRDCRGFQHRLLAWPVQLLEGSPHSVIARICSPWRTGRSHRLGLARSPATGQPRRAAPTR